MADIPKDIYCFHCGEKFTKTKTEGFEECPHCEKGFDDLSEESQYAVKQLMKAWIEHCK